MADVAPLGSDILNVVIEASCDALDQAILVFSRADALLFASRNLQKFYPVASDIIQPGTSLRDFLGGVFDTGVMRGVPGAALISQAGAEEWISQRIASMWSERSEKVERLGRERWLSIATRRIANGLGIMLLRDVSAVRKMEDRWTGDMERVAMTEEILDNLPEPVFVQDRNLAFVAVNKAYCKLQGVLADSILGRSVWDLVDQAMAEVYEAEARRVLETGTSSKIAEDILTADGKVMSTIKHRFRIGKPGHFFVVTLLQDFSDVVVRDRYDLPDVPDFQDMYQSLDKFPDADAIPAPFQELNGLFSKYNSDLEMVPAKTEVTPDTDASRVLILSADDVFGETLVSALTAFNFDAFRAADIDEAAAVLYTARSMGVPVDLVLADDNISKEALDGAGLDGTMVISVNEGRPVHFAVADTAAYLAGRSALSRHGKLHDAPTPQTYDKAVGPVDAFTAPDAIALPDFDDQGEAVNAAGYGVEVLVVEDNPINQEVFGHILSSLGISFQLARDGAEGVRLWETMRPVLVLMDTTLPLLDGKAATRRIRQIEAGSRSHTAIVGVLPHPSDLERQDCLSNGMDDVIVKPLNVEAIERLYRHHVLGRFVVNSKAKSA